jgi:hypothetical protein
MKKTKLERLRERFFRMVSSTPTERGCRAWLGHVRPNGYGTFELCVGGEASGELAHRMAYALATGNLKILRLYGGPGDKRGPVVRHVGPGDGAPCDFKSCVEFSHLAFGTHRENVEDNAAHGTLLRGASVGTSHLTEDDVREIRRRYAVLTGRTPYGFARDLAREFDTSPTYLRGIVTRQTWKHID